MLLLLFGGVLLALEQSLTGTVQLLGVAAVMLATGRWLLATGHWRLGGG